MKRGRRQVLAALCLLALPACNPKPVKEAASASPASSPTPTAPALHITGQGTTLRPIRGIYQRNNRVDYELLASSFDSRGPQGKARTVFQTARVTFHGRNGSTTTAVAPQAIVDQTANTVTLVDRVNAQTSTGMILECDRLVYDRLSQMLHGTGHVVIVDPNGFRGTGSSFDSDISLTHMRMQ